MNGWTIPHRNSNIYCPWNSAFQTVWIKTDLLKCILWCYTNCRKKPQNIPLSESKTNAVHYLLVFCRWKKSLCFLKISSSESVLSAFSLLSMVIPWGTCHSWNFQKDSRELVVEKCCTPQKLQDKFAFKQKWNTGFKKKKNTMERSTSKSHHIMPHKPNEFCLKYFQSFFLFLLNYLIRSIFIAFLEKRSCEDHNVIVTTFLVQQRLNYKI